jgi:hypothetical protein
MKLYNKVNNLAGWAVFLIAAITYLLTIEPTASFWDCGEFIATSYKLEVGHPPGAPLFMMTGRVFSLFAFGDVTKVALMVNVMSALASAFTILFLFWSITYFARKIILKDYEYTTGQLIAIMASGVVGALAYTFSDTFWFSAVEGEVYASSSFFTAIVFWAILKWESVSEQKYANRWIILIAYLMGLSIGVHLLNLLAIPAIVFVYYFKKYEPTRKGILVAFSTSIVILGLVMYGVIQGLIKMMAQFDLFFVNSLGMPFNSGVFFLMAALLGGLAYGIHYTQKRQKALLNTIFLSFMVILIGYSSFFMIVIRSSANTVLNENNPSHAFSLLSYLNREQYGDRPLLYGEYYNAPAIEEIKQKTYIQDKKMGKYVEITKSNPKYVFDPQFKTVFPRMYSRSGSHQQAYKTWANIEGTPVTVTRDGNPETLMKPTFGENLVFFFGYQVAHMYLRYFMWNFAGRQNDIQGHGGYSKGNWISGIPAIDNKRLGSDKNQPKFLKNNKSKNKYYFLPLILGLLGLLYTINRNVRSLIIIGLLFFFTGLAIVIYLNQTPYQPRERDYAYAGSFYAFAIWIGLGVLWLWEMLSKPLGQKISAISVGTVSLILVPGIMAAENWDDHDRSGRYTARDFGADYLNSCDKNAILFTYGDNDTFPLWYVQEVEGERTDVRVVNLSLLGTDWYINQMRYRAYESAPVPFSMPAEKYVEGQREFLIVYEEIKNEYVDIRSIVKFIQSDNLDAKIKLQDGEMVNYIPSRKIKIPVDTIVAKKNGLIPPEIENKGILKPFIYFTLSKDYLTKSDMMVLDLLANYKWDRPLYFATSINDEDFLGLQGFVRHEGLAYRLVPFETKAKDGEYGYIDEDILYDRLMKKFRYGRMNEPDFYFDYQHVRTVQMILNFRTVFARCAHKLIEKGKNKKAIEVLDLATKIMPNDRLPYNGQNLAIIDAYYKAGKPEQAIKETNILVKEASDNLRYLFDLERVSPGGNAYEMKQHLYPLQELIGVSKNNGQEALSQQVERVFKQYYNSFAASQSYDKKN